MKPDVCHGKDQSKLIANESHVVDFCGLQGMVISERVTFLPGNSRLTDKKSVLRCQGRGSLY